MNPSDNPYIGRIVTLLSPIFAGLAGSICVWVAENFPGAPELDSGELTAIFVAGATAAGGALVTWLYNRGKYERGEK
jgi:hypothetical protein